MMVSTRPRRQDVAPVMVHARALSLVQAPDAGSPLAQELGKMARRKGPAILLPGLQARRRAEETTRKTQGLACGGQVQGLRRAVRSEAYRRGNLLGRVPAEVASGARRPLIAQPAGWLRGLWRDGIEAARGWRASL